MSQHNEKKVAIWRSRIERAIVRRTEEKKIWDKNLTAYRGQLRPDVGVWAKNDPWVSVELVHSSIRAAVPSLLYSNPKFTITPKKPIAGPNGQDISWDLAHSKEIWAEHIWGETNGNEHLRLGIIAAFLALGAWKVGYSPDFQDDERRGQFLFDDQFNLTPGQTDAVTGQKVPVLEKGEYLLDEDGNFQWDEDTGLPLLHPGTLLKEEFFVEWVPWMNMLFDPEGGSVFANHKWVIEEAIRPLEEVRNDPRYIRSVAKRVVASAKVGERPGDDTRPTVSSTIIEKDAAEAAAERDQERVKIFTIWDFQENRVYELPDHVDGDHNSDFLLDNQIPTGIEHGPYVFLRFNQNPGEWYPRTDAEAMAKVELNYNLLQSQMLTHRNQSRTRYSEVQNAGFTDDREREKFRSGGHNTVVQVKSQDGVVPMRKDALDGNFFSAPVNVLQDFSQVSGQPGEQRGVADAQTATQASILSSGADLRNSDRRDNLVQAAASEIMRKLLQAAAANAEVSVWAKIATPEKNPNPFELREVLPSDLEGEFDTEVAMGSTQPKNSNTRVTMLEKIVLLFSQNPVIALAPTLTKRIFEAIDIDDDQMVQELVNVAKQVLGAQNSQGGQGDAQAQSGQNPDQIANQFIQGVGSAAGGTPTGGGIN